MVITTLAFQQSSELKAEMGLPPYDDYEGGYPA